MAGEDVEDHGGAVDDRQPELGLEAALLARAELVVAGDDVRVGPARCLLDLLELAGADVAVGVGLLAVLDGLPDHRDARGAQELAQLGEVLAVGQRGDAEGALAGPAGPGAVRARGGRDAPVAAALHPLAV